MEKMPKERQKWKRKEKASKEEDSDKKKNTWIGNHGPRNSLSSPALTVTPPPTQHHHHHQQLQPQRLKPSQHFSSHFFKKIKFRTSIKSNHTHTKKKKRHASATGHSLSLSPSLTKPLRVVQWHNRKEELFRLTHRHINTTNTYKVNFRERTNEQWQNQTTLMAARSPPLPSSPSVRRCFSPLF